MATRDKTAVVQLKARMREPLRARLEAAAKRRGVPLNTELVDRLEQSFAKEDAFDGPEMLNMARLMATAFIRGGQSGAYARGHADWKPAQWMNDPLCYSAAVRAVAHALNAAQPVLHDPAHPNSPKNFLDMFTAAAARTEAMLNEPELKSQRTGGSKGGKNRKPKLER